MAEKKKKAAKEEDFSTEQLVRIYRRRCEANGVPACKLFREKLSLAIEETEHIEKVSPIFLTSSAAHVGADGSGRSESPYGKLQRKFVCMQQSA